jgi:hypothetical protein
MQVRMFLKLNLALAMMPRYVKQLVVFAVKVKAASEAVEVLFEVEAGVFANGKDFEFEMKDLMAFEKLPYFLSFNWH